MPDYKEWLRKVPGDSTKFKRIMCHKSYSLSTAGKSAVTEHNEGKKHKALVNKKMNFFVSESNETSKEGQSDGTVIVGNTSTSKKQQNHIKNRYKMEIHTRWLIRMVLSGHSYRSIKDFGDLMPVLFDDSEKAKNCHIKRQKASYLVTHGIALHFKKILEKEISISKIHVLCFDESLNDSTQKCEMDILIRYWCEEEKMVKVRYDTSSLLGHATAKNLMEHFTEACKNLNNGKLYQVSMDGPNVNLKFLRLLKEQIGSGVLHELIDIGSCNLCI